MGIPGTITRFLLLLTCACSLPGLIRAQEGFNPTIKKPKEFENRLLRSEKTDKKLTAPKRFIQNTVSHYNYFFNASNKVNEVINRAKLVNKDQFDFLLPFYNYSLDVTAADSIQLDSIAFKSQSGIVLHDLRSDWADNFYLLWGVSYFLQKQFDSAYNMFQFINHSFAKKESDGYYLAIGSARDGNDARSISTKEKSSWFKRAPSRNDAFIWQIRNHLEQDHFTQAASLVQALRNDPSFPERLEADLEEMQAYYFYRQEQWDSAAVHLENALPNAGTKQEQARWEYLIAQLYENTGRFALSNEYYQKSIGHTTDPVMDVYARLGSVRVNRDEKADAIDRNIATLVKMAGRDKYVDYRDIIYYMAAQMELERDNTDGALDLLYRSTRYATNNPPQRNKAFLQLAELSFEKRRYRDSKNFYDSLSNDDPAIKNPDQVKSRKDVLSKIVKNMDIMDRQDSLQRLAALPESDRRDLVKKMVRKLRKQQGLKDEGAVTLGSAKEQTGKTEPPPSMFSNNSKGEWYFYNNNLRSKGNTDFKSRFGTRPNVDNWRRGAAVIAKLNAKPDNYTPDQPLTSGSTEGIAGTPEITYDYLYGKLPLTAELLKASNDSVQGAMFENGVLYIQELEDCITGTTTLEAFRTRFPGFTGMDEVLFNLYYCYNRNGDKVKTDPLKAEMIDKFGDSEFTSIVKTGKRNSPDLPQEAPTRLYENIYDQFIEGDFTAAVARKKTADSLYGKNYWTPQLLYVEAVYYIKQREDSTAKKVLGNIISQFTGKPIAVKAENLLSVLNRRAQIEEELRNMQLVMPADDSTQVAVAPVPKPEPEPEPIDPKRPGLRDVPRDKNGKPVIEAGKDPIAAKGTAGVGVTKPVVPEVIAKPDTATKQPPAVVTAGKDTAAAAPVVVSSPKTDTVVAKPPVNLNSFSFDGASPHYVVLVLSKVDPIFVGEARNAFFRYNRDYYYNKPMNAELSEIDKDNRLLLISPFKTAEEAVAYVDETKPKTASNIIPWLKGGRYFFLIISEKNLGVLKTTKDVEAYRQFLDRNIPGKF
ncbi:MAG: hypothetical protein EOO09_16650 [Chitinophagaceae bacterium]|nr:MAG: hypothetical protein EOO09_16650 [Chitinophagaceae bacterium]